MRISVEIDGDLLNEAMAVCGLSPERTVEEALRQLIVSHHRREAIRASAGIGWDGPDPT